jgi:Leucine-rich repeat (LRR) protein
LSCSYNQLKNIPSLPASLTSLWCNYNQLTCIPSLPASLAVLSCDNNDITSLPASLPASLTRLWCNSNKLTKIPEKYLDVIKRIEEVNNDITLYNIYRTSLVNEIPLRIIQEKHLINVILQYI